MVVDTSALVALFLGEDGHEIFADLIDFSEDASVSVVSRVELVSVLCGRRIGASLTEVTGFVEGLNLSDRPVTIRQMMIAADALLRFGKGRHPAALNLGDCFPYALSKELGTRLLFKGDDFARTDIEPAWRPGEGAH